MSFSNVVLGTLSTTSRVPSSSTHLYGQNLQNSDISTWIGNTNTDINF